VVRGGGRLKISDGDTHANGDAGQQHERKICRRTCKRHPRRAAWVAALPVGIERRARPPNHPSSQQERQNRHYHHPEQRLANVGNGVERHLAAFERGEVAADFGGERVRRFVARRRKQKDDVPDDAKRKVRCVHRRVAKKWCGSGAWTRTRITSSKGWRATNCTTPE